MKFDNKFWFILLFMTTIIAMMISLNIVSAEIKTLPPVKQGNCVDLPQLEFNSSYQTLTSIQFPNKTIIYINANFTKNGNNYNYTFCETNSTGFYIVNGCSDITCWNYDFEVTPNGAVFDISKAIIIAILGTFLVLTLVFVLGMFLNSSSTSAKVAYFNITYLIALAVLFLTWYVASNFLYIIPFLGDMLYYSWFILMILLFPEIIASIGIMIISNLNAARQKRLVSMGHSADTIKRR